MLNKTAAVLAALSIFVSGAAVSALANESADETAVYVNGERLEFDQPPIIKNDRILVPLRAVFEALNAEVSWNDETQTVTARSGETVIILGIGSNILTVGEDQITLEAAPELVEDRTLVPLRAVSESLNASVEWNEDSRLVTVTTENAEYINITPVSGAVFEQNAVLRSAGVISDSEFKGDLTVDIPQGEAVLDNVNIDGDLIIRSAGRVDFSGRANKLLLLSENTDVYAISDNAEFADSEISGENSNIITKSYADYQQVDWTENKIRLSTGIDLAYTVTGPEDGTPVVLIHGLTDGRVSWSQVAPVLADKGYRVYVPEYRGNGKTDKPYGNEEAYSVEALTEDIAEFLDELNIEKAHIVGHSLGSIIAQELNISYRDKISSITLIGSGASVDSDNEVIDWLVNGDGESFKGIFAYDDTQKLPEDFIEAWGYSTNPDADFQAANLEHLRQTPYYVWKALVSNLLKFNNTDRLKDITGDVQIIWGSDDAVFPKEQQELLKAGLTNSNVIFHEIEGADHNTHWGSEEAVDTVAGFIDSFIKGQS